MSIVTYNNRSIANISAIPGAAKSLTHIKTLTASSSSTLSFVNGSSDVVLDNTYPIYLFKFISCHPSDDESALMFNMSVDTGSNYNVTKTTTMFRTYNHETDGYTALQYITSQDLAQSTGDATIGYGVGNDNDQTLSGELYLFNPSSTTFVKHYLGAVSEGFTDGAINRYVAGYCNVTAAIDAVQFKMNSGTMDSGTIKLYGLKDS